MYLAQGYLLTSNLSVKSMLAFMKATSTEHFMESFVTSMVINLMEMLNLFPEVQLLISHFHLIDFLHHKVCLLPFVSAQLIDVLIFRCSVASV